MGPVTYSLCIKPVIGIALLLVGACSFPPLIADMPLSLLSEGTPAQQDLEVEVDKYYFFEMKFVFSSAAAGRNDHVIGTGSNYGKHCEGQGKVDDVTPFLQEGAGRPIPIQVVVSKSPDREVVEDRVFWTMCRFASGGDKDHPEVWRKIGRVHLAPGHYRASITNLQRQSGLDGVVTTVSLVAGNGKSM
jgi:hypothetical protein